MSGSAHAQRFESNPPCSVWPPILLHGESLGESNLYLHGLPMLLAPPEQTRVPMLVWLSAGAAQRLQLAAGALQGNYSHDNLFHTLLAPSARRRRSTGRNSACGHPRARPVGRR